MDKSLDCIIVGGGIGGAVLALALGRKGRSVTVLERASKTPPTAGRPEILSRATIESFGLLGVGERVLKESAIPLQGIKLSHPKKGLLFHLMHEDFVRSSVQPHTTDPARTRLILIEEASKQAYVTIEQGVEVKELIKEGSKVIGVRAEKDGNKIEFYSKLVVGDDGGKSRIRLGMGIPLKMTEIPLVFVGNEGPRLPSQKEIVGEAWIHPRNVKRGIFGGIFMPLPGERTALAFLMTQERYDFYIKDPSQFYKTVKELSPLCESLEKTHPFPGNYRLFHRPFGHAPRYVADGAALLGDAAHPVTPAGGQGANMSVADAMALAKVAEEAFETNDFSSKKLAAYEQMRREANQRSLQFSVRANQLVRTLRFCPWLEPLLLAFLKRVDHTPATKDRFIRKVSRTFLSTP